VPQRMVEVDAFQRGHRDAFLISLEAGGVGLNLTAASYVVHLDPWWRPAAEDQATDRAHRIGQALPVTVLKLMAVDTIEEQVLLLHRDKRKLVHDLLAGTEASASLTPAAMLELLRG
jgi:SNF2 family DNA or RNA helicase